MREKGEKKVNLKRLKTARKKISRSLDRKKIWIVQKGSNFVDELLIFFDLFVEDLVIKNLI